MQYWWQSPHYCTYLSMQGKILNNEWIMIVYRRIQSLKRGLRDGAPLHTIYHTHKKMKKSQYPNTSGQSRNPALHLCTSLARIRQQFQKYKFPLYRVTQKKARVHFKWYLLYLDTDCPYFTGHGRINNREYTKTPVGAETTSTLCWILLQDRFV